MAYYKIRCENLIFPGKVKISDRFGVFEIYVSRSESIINNRDYDFVFNTNEYSIHYDYTDNIKHIYFAVKAVERLKMQFMVCFEVNQEAVRASQRVFLKSMESEKMPARKAGAYEFFKKGMRQDEFDDLKELVCKIFCEGLEGINGKSRGDKERKEAEGVNVSRG